MDAERIPRVGKQPQASAIVEARDVSRRFGTKLALSGVDLRVERGQLHALLGPNGAGKTTLLRVLTGLVHPSSGSVRIMGVDARRDLRALRRQVGFIPSGDRSFYLRVSGLENLVFFARLHGMRRKHALARAFDVLDEVGLHQAARVRLNEYSHGMHKRLSVARALLTDPAVLLVDEATHDLDPDGARRVRALVADLAHRGTAVVWTTQRVDEIRGFVDKVTLLGNGQVRFAGTVPELMAHSVPRRYFVGLRNGRLQGSDLELALTRALAGRATITRAGEGGSEHYILSLADGVVLGDALVSVSNAGIQVFACREERSEIEEAFLSLTAEGSA